MAVRVLLVLAVLAVLYGCGQSSPAPQESEKEGGVEPKTVTPSGSGEGENQGEASPQAVGNMPIAGTIGENVRTSSFDLRVLDYFVSDRFYYLTDPYLDQTQDYVSEAGKFVVVNYSVTNTSAETIEPAPMGRLHAKPTNALTPELLDELRAHKTEIVQILREDEEMRRTGIIQAERQVFDLAREYFGGQDEAGAA